MSTTSQAARPGAIPSGVRQAPAVFRLFGQGGLPYGWLVLLLAFALALYLPFAIGDINWIDNTQVLWPTAVLAVALGLLIGLARPNDVRGLIGGMLAGFLGIFTAIGSVIPGPARLASDITETGRWIVTRGASEPAGVNPLVRMWGAGWDAAASFGSHIVTWWRLGGFGEAAIDDRIFLFLLAVVSWSVTFYFAWALYSRVAPVIALLPPGVVLVTFVVLGGQGATYVYLYLLTSLFLILRIHVLSLMKIWNGRNLDYPTSVSAELLATGLFFTLIVGGVALILPTAPQNVFAVHFWRVFDAPWSVLETSVGEAFTGVRHRVGGNGGNDLYLGGPLAFGENHVIFDAATDEAPPPDVTDHEIEDEEGYVEPEHYFLGATFAAYDGRGWEPGKTAGISRTGVPIGPDGQPHYLGVSGSGDTVQEHAANQPVVSAPPSGQKIVQQITLQDDPSPLLYAYNVPVLVDQPYQLHATGGYPDQLDLKPGTKKYTVVSIEPEASAPELRADSTNYPAWLAPYLAKPNVPARVAQLAVQWAGKANNPYDKAMAIEGELRKIPYTTDVAAPPAGHDAVDYFLFDAKRGYCEYYASAMVVMLREVGVPARIATGYATTTYNRAKSAYEVSDSDAHTWVQVFFPGLGWLNFEPTPVNPELVRPETGDESVTTVVVPPPPAPHAAPRLRLPVDPRVLIGALIAALAALAAWIIRRQWEAELAAADFVRVMYGRMVRWGGRFGLPKRPEETALEYGYRLAAHFELTAEPLALAARQLATLYVLAQYAHAPLGTTERTRAGEAWHTLRFQLWKLRRRRRT